MPISQRYFVVQLLNVPLLGSQIRTKTEDQRSKTEVQRSKWLPTVGFISRVFCGERKKMDTIRIVTMMDHPRRSMEMEKKRADMMRSKFMNRKGRNLY